MRVLVGWDDSEEVELLSLYLEVDGTEVVLAASPENLVERFKSSRFEVVLFPVTYPDADASYQLFESLTHLDAQVPILVAARPGEVYPLSRLLRSGLRSHVYRDPDREYLFLLQTLLQSTVAGKRAEDARVLAERLRAEIDSVRALQESIISKELSPPAGYEMAARYEPSQIQVAGGKPVILAGGDYYYAYQLTAESMVILVGDASGHGMKACMSIMTMHTLINQLHEAAPKAPHEFVARINRQLCSHDLIQGEGGFITLLYGILTKDELRWTSAGHCPPLLQNLETGESIELCDPIRDGGLPLALDCDAEYETIVSKIPPGHRLVIYTDGIIEAMPDTAKFGAFGLDGLKNTLSRCRRMSLPDTLESLFHDSYEFTAGSGRHDDTSVFLVEHKAL